VAKIKSLDKIAKKWDDRVGVSSADYLDGVKAPTKDWAEGALAAKDNYNAAIQLSIKQGRREKGIAEAGTAKWQKKTVEKSGRWASGVSGAVDDMKKGFQPYHDTISALDYGPRFPAGDPRNIERVKIGNVALHKKKVEIKSL